MVIEILEVVKISNAVLFTGAEKLFGDSNNPLTMGCQATRLRLLGFIVFVLQTQMGFANVFQDDKCLSNTGCIKQYEVNKVKRRNFLI